MKSSDSSKLAASILCPILVKPQTLRVALRSVMTDAQRKLSQANLATDLWAASQHKTQRKKVCLSLLKAHMMRNTCHGIYLVAKPSQMLQSSNSCSGPAPIQSGSLIGSLWPLPYRNVPSQSHARLGLFSLPVNIVSMLRSRGSGTCVAGLLH